MSTTAQPVESAPPYVPRPEPTGFRRELTPTWLAASVLVDGHRPPQLHGRFHAAYLGCTTGLTPVVVAAVHPEAQIWAWDWRPTEIRILRELRDELGLDNLEVHERPFLPTMLGPELQDLVVIEGVVDTIEPGLRHELFTSLGRSLRPGGAVCITYRTTVGWAEIVPVHRLVRHIASRGHGNANEVATTACDFIARLRDGGATYLADRPVVSAWIDELLTKSPAHVVHHYLDRELRPASHAQVAHAMAAIGCSFVNQADFADVEVDLSAMPIVRGLIDRAATHVLRESLKDLAVRRATRMDVFMLGAQSLDEHEHRVALSNLSLARLDGAQPGTNDAPAPDRVPRSPSELRRLLRSGQMHPYRMDAIPPAVTSIARAVDARSALGNGLRIVPELGTALPARTSDPSKGTSS
jgi:precorrin-6B methylase 2